MERKLETLKKLQSLLEAEFVIDNRLVKARAHKDKFKALRKQAEKEKSKAIENIDSLRRKLEEEEASMKIEAENIRQTTEKKMQKYDEDIKRLQKMIMEFSLAAADISKIAALNVTKRLAVFQENFSEAPYVKRERECVMCLTNEISVVFIPCAHQVLCVQCNVIHEKHGMTDCPSCRTAIQKRVSVIFRVD